MPTRSRPTCGGGRGGLLVLEHDLLPASAAPQTLLADLVELAPGRRVRLDIELKEAGYEREVLEALDPRPDGLLISSFLPEAVAAVRALDASVGTALLIAAADGGGDLFARADAMRRRPAGAQLSCSMIALA